MDALRLILAPHAGCVGTLCVAACVSRAWHAASKERELWTSLTDFVFVKVDDARLAELVTRAGSGVDGQPHLQQLDVTKCKNVTTRGVVAALTGAALEGKLQRLSVAGTLSFEGDEDVLDVLRTFLDDSPWGPRLDVYEQLLCGTTEPAPCLRLCRYPVCDICEPQVNRCHWCYPRKRSVNTASYVFCEHICAYCGYRPDNALLPCAGCSGCEGERFFACQACSWSCGGDCEQWFCYQFCINSAIQCQYCGTAYCDECSDGIDWQFCELCNCTWCLSTPEERSAVNLQSAAEWIAELQEREGGLSAEALERLLKLVLPANKGGEYEDEEGLVRICEYCVDHKILEIAEDD